MDIAVLISIIVVAALVVLLGLFFWASYTSLVTLKTRVDEAWRDIRTQLQRRSDLVPPLVNAVRGNAAHERAVYDAVETARTETAAAATPAEASAAENHLQQALKSLYGVAESFPRLQSSPEFLQMRSDLAEAEERIQGSRRFYNGGVREFNTKITGIPNTLFARRLHLSQREFFEVPDGARAQPPRVQF